MQVELAFTSGNGAHDIVELSVVFLLVLSDVLKYNCIVLFFWGIISSDGKTIDFPHGMIVWP